jgi:hypothetical protein
MTTTVLPITDTLRAAASARNSWFTPAIRSLAAAANCAMSCDAAAVASASVILRLATCPNACPPMPSATTHRPRSGCAR